MSVCYSEVGFFSPYAVKYLTQIHNITPMMSAGISLMCFRAASRSAQNYGSPERPMRKCDLKVFSPVFLTLEQVKKRFCLDNLSTSLHVFESVKQV